ncbi:MAG: hypothetical protein JNK74_04180 [Candidatus Hydrogenedentes bacterium]|nr:hypothetical protein [Candidatus Hydrogenedentota bacterium]
MLLTALLLVAACPAPAQDEEAPPVRTGIEAIDWAAEQVNFTLREAEPASDGANAATVQEEKMPVLSPTHSIEAMEMMRLQQEIRLLRELIEEGMVNRVTALEAEVRDLKATLRGEQPVGPVVPKPDEPARARLPQPEPGAATEAKPEMSLEDLAAAQLPAVPAEEFKFTVVDEWGRSPEAVAELGGTASTLIGVAGLVPAGSTRDDVVALAQELRTKYRVYDNIVIEVFDDASAAQDFADSQKVNAERRVLSIAKSKAEGRDLMIYFGGELPEALTP